MAKKAVVVELNGVKLVLNKPARQLFGDADSVRVKVEEDYILVRPTKRTKGLGNFKAPEKMIALKKSVATTTFMMPGDEVTADAYKVTSRNYGWYALSAVAAGEISSKMPVVKASR